MTDSINLIGDSIFDNAVYVPGEPCVTEQLRERVPQGVDVSMLAVDGDYVDDVHRQIKSLSAQATHLFISMGGNDALRYSNRLFASYSDSKEMFKAWCDIQKSFRRDYKEMLRAVSALERKTAVCTVYDAVPGIEDYVITALSLFNDVIVSEAVDAGVPVIDLRTVCPEPADYSAQSPIEPSAQGGGKIAEALDRVYREHDFDALNTVIYS